MGAEKEISVNQREKNPRRLARKKDKIQFLEDVRRRVVDVIREWIIFY